MEENLVDYVVCMPWSVPEQLKQQACDLVTMLGSFPDMRMQPPQLLNIAKASLAKTFPELGLEGAMKLTAGEIATKLLPDTDNKLR